MCGGFYRAADEGIDTVRVCEVVAGRATLNVAGQSAASANAKVKTAFEKNATKLRGKERRLNAQKPVKPVKHGPQDRPSQLLAVMGLLLDVLRDVVTLGERVANSQPAPSPCAVCFR